MKNDTKKTKAKAEETKGTAAEPKPTDFAWSRYITRAGVWDIVRKRSQCGGWPRVADLLQEVWKDEKHTNEAFSAFATWLRDNDFYVVSSHPECPASGLTVIPRACRGIQPEGVLQDIKEAVKVLTNISATVRVVSEGIQSEIIRSSARQSARSALLFPGYYGECQVPLPDGSKANPSQACAASTALIVASIDAVARQLQNLLHELQKNPYHESR